MLLKIVTNSIFGNLSLISFLGACMQLWIGLLLMISSLTCKMNGKRLNVQYMYNIQYLIIMRLFYDSRMRLCMDISDSEVERAKNAFLTSMFMHLDGEDEYYCMYMYSTLYSNCYEHWVQYKYCTCNKTLQQRLFMPHACHYDW